MPAPSALEAPGVSSSAGRLPRSVGANAAPVHLGWVPRTASARGGRSGALRNVLAAASHRCTGRAGRPGSAAALHRRHGPLDPVRPAVHEVLRRTHRQFTSSCGGLQGPTWRRVSSDGRRRGHQQPARSGHWADRNRALQALQDVHQPVHQLGGERSSMAMQPMRDAQRRADLELQPHRPVCSPEKGKPLSLMWNTLD